MELNPVTRRMDDFRLYYNHTIHPELMRMERYRIRLIRLLFFSLLFLIGITLFTLYLDIWAFTLFLSIPLAGYIAYLGYRIRGFIQRFKPAVMNLILDFIDNTPNFGTLQYQADRKIEKERFLKSGIFSTKAEFYEGEDFISGRIGEMPFEMSELSVREVSQVGARLDVVFEGVFLYATFNEENEGSVMVWPRRERPFLSRAMKEYTWKGGKNKDDEILNESFREHHIVYATEETHVVGTLTEPMQDAILDMVKKTGKKVYISFQNKEIFAAITEPKDLLEPFIFRSNMRFDLIREFYEDIYTVMRIVELFDRDR